PHNAIHGGSDFVADCSEEAGLCEACEFCTLTCIDQCSLGLFARSDVARDRPVRDIVAVLVAHRQFYPGEPARTLSRTDLNIGGTQALAIRKCCIWNDSNINADLGQCSPD